MNSCQRFAEDRAPFTGHHKLSFSFSKASFPSLALLHQPAPHFIPCLQKMLPALAGSPGMLPGPTCGCRGSPHPIPLVVTLPMHRALCKAWAEVLLALRMSRRDWPDGPAMPQNFPVLLHSRWAHSAAVARLRKLLSDGSSEKGNRGKVF